MNRFFNNFETSFASRVIRRKIIDTVPLIIPNAKFSPLHLYKHSLVVILMWIEYNIAARLYNRLSLWVEHDLKIMAVSESELLASYYHPTVLGVSNKCRAITWTHHNLWIQAIVYESSFMIIMNIYVAFFASHYSKLLPVDSSKFYLKPYYVYPGSLNRNLSFYLTNW